MINFSQAITELETLDIDTELDSHEKLTNWTTHNNNINALRRS